MTNEKIEVLKKLEDNLRQLRMILEEEQKQQEQLEQQKQLQQLNETNEIQELETVTSLIKLIGIPANLKGYHYIRTSIIMVLKDTTLLEQITKGLYVKVAKYYKTTPERVERAMRHAIGKCWSNSEEVLIKSIFGNTLSGKIPTNSIFIAGIVDYLSKKQ